MAEELTPMQAAKRAIDSAKRKIEKWRSRDREQVNLFEHVDSIELFAKYADPSDNEADTAFIAVTNWNNDYRWSKHRRESRETHNLMTRLGDYLESLGGVTDWEDQTRECDECHNLVRTEPDFHGQDSKYVHLPQGDMICRVCVLSRPEILFEALHGVYDVPSMAFAKLDPADHGYTRVSLGPFGYEELEAVCTVLERNTYANWLFWPEPPDKYVVYMQQPEPPDPDRMPAWARNANVLSLVAVISNNRAWDRLPVLADALEDSGYTDAETLAVLRGNRRGEIETEFEGLLEDMRSPLLLQRDLEKVRRKIGEI